MPGQSNFFIGVATLVIGTVVTVGSYAIAPGGMFVVAYGAILVGAIQAVIGVFQYLAYALNSPQKKAEHHVKMDVRTLVRSMIAVAAADGVLEEGEIAIIEMVSSSIFGTALDEQSIRGLYKEFVDNPNVFDEELRSVASQLTADGAKMTIKACTMVAMADGDFSVKEEELISKIAAYFRLAEEDIATSVTEGANAIRELINAQQAQQA